MVEKEKEVESCSQSENEISFKVKANGLSVPGAVFFIVGDVVGAGIVTLPYTMRLVGWLGIPLFILAALLMCLCGVLLAKGCLILYEDIPNREELRDPYPRLAEKAFGRFAKHGVVFALNSSLVLACIVLLLLLGEIFTQFAPLPLQDLSDRGQLRLWFIICGLAILPLTFLGTPKDFAGIGILATACSVIAFILIMLNIAMTGHNYGITMPTRINVDPETLLASFGTIQFTFGGIAIFPTIQNDLKEPEKFPYAVFCGYCIVLFVYTTVSLSAFIVLDGKVQEDILSSFSSYSLYKNCRFFRAYVIIAQVMLCGHVFCAIVMIINPVNQQIEQLLGTPIDFTWKRIAVRSSVAVFVVVIAIAIPNFGPVLSLAGGTLFSLLNVIFPILFYYKLAHNINYMSQAIFATIILLTLATSVGNGFVEVKNVIKVIKGSYKV